MIYKQFDIEFSIWLLIWTHCSNLILLLNTQSLYNLLNFIWQNFASPHVSKWQKTNSWYIYIEDVHKISLICIIIMFLVLLTYTISRMPHGRWPKNFQLRLPQQQQQHLSRILRITMNSRFFLLRLLSKDGNIFSWKNEK